MTLVAVLGLGAGSLMLHAQRRQLRPGSSGAASVYEPVSILKPLKGVDADLETNLESFFRLDYPAYEVLFGLDDPQDPALAVARAVAARHPGIPSRLVVSERRAGHNPKVNNLANIMPAARHELILISDSNVRVHPGYLRELVARIEEPGVGLVSSPFRGTHEHGIGGVLEALQLNSFVIGGVCAVSQLWSGVCVVGKSMLLRRSTLGAMGGFSFLSRFLAEDQVCGEEVAALGMRTAVAHHCVDNVLGEVSLSRFLGRHLRWARIRRRMNISAYLCELLLNPLVVAMAGCALAPSRHSLAVVLLTGIARVMQGREAEAIAGVQRPVWTHLWLVPLRDLLVGAVWVVPFFATTVSWRGNRLRIGPRTLLIPESTSPAPALEPSQVEV